MGPGGPARSMHTLRAPGLHTEGGDVTFCVFYTTRASGRGRRTGAGSQEGLRGLCGPAGGAAAGHRTPSAPSRRPGQREGLGYFRWKALSGTHAIILHTSGSVKYFIIGEIFIRDLLNI